MKTTIRHVWVEDHGGFDFGMDAFTPVSFVFSNRLIKNAYTSFNLGPVADSETVQDWIQNNKHIVISKHDLAKKLLQIWSEGKA